MIYALVGQFFMNYFQAFLILAWFLLTFFSVLITSVHFFVGCFIGKLPLALKVSFTMFHFLKWSTLLHISDDPSAYVSFQIFSFTFLSVLLIFLLIPWFQYHVFFCLNDPFIHLQALSVTSSRALFQKF